MIDWHGKNVINFPITPTDDWVLDLLGIPRNEEQDLATLTGIKIVLKDTE